MYSIRQPYKVPQPSTDEGTSSGRTTPSKAYETDLQTAILNYGLSWAALLKMMEDTFSEPVLALYSCWRASYWTAAPATSRASTNG